FHVSDFAHLLAQAPGERHLPRSAQTPAVYNHMCRSCANPLLGSAVACARATRGGNLRLCQRTPGATCSTHGPSLIGSHHCLQESSSLASAEPARLPWRGGFTIPRIVAGRTLRSPLQMCLMGSSSPFSRGMRAAASPAHSMIERAH